MGDPSEESAASVKPLHPWYTRLWRLARLDYYKILRAHGAPAQVARGVGYGIFVELIFFPTLGLAFFLIYPLNKYLKGHLAASIAGFVFAKLFAFLTIPPSFILGSKMLGLPSYGDRFMTDTAHLKPLGEIWDIVMGLLKSGELFHALAGWTVSAAAFGVIMGAIGFLFSLTALRKYQAHKKERRREILREKETANA